MYYEVITPSGSVSIVRADSNREAKAKVCKEHGFKQSDRWTGISSMTARKLQEDYLQTLYQA